MPSCPEFAPEDSYRRFAFPVKATAGTSSALSRGRACPATPRKIAAASLWRSTRQQVDAALHRQQDNRDNGSLLLVHPLHAATHSPHPSVFFRIADFAELDVLVKNLPAAAPTPGQVAGGGRIGKKIPIDERFRLLDGKPPQFIGGGQASVAEAAEPHGIQFGNKVLPGPPPVIDFVFVVN